MKIRVTDKEALILISLELSDFLLEELRDIIYSSFIKKAKTKLIDFNLETLRYIEAVLPIYGSIDEEVYSPLRVKISCSIKKYKNEFSTEELINEINQRSKIDVKYKDKNKEKIYSEAHNKERQDKETQS